MTLSNNIRQIKQRIDKALIAANRQPGSARLLAVSKGQSLDKIQKAVACGIIDFGENYLQEALSKMEQMKQSQLCWHFIGPIQSNKTKDIAMHFDWVHSLDRLKVADKLNHYRQSLPPLNILLQINLDEEPSKAGVRVQDIDQILPDLLERPHLRLRGLMAIPKPRTLCEDQIHSFLRLEHLRAELNQRYQLNLDTLSMGMSQDFEAAIDAGSTIVRVGEALFGSRS